MALSSLTRGFDEYFGYTSGHWGEYNDPPLEENGRMIRAGAAISSTFARIGPCNSSTRIEIDHFLLRPLHHASFALVRAGGGLAAIPEQTPRAAREPRRPGKLDETTMALAMMENQDRNVGRVLAKLDEFKLSANTIVLYFSDNGPNTMRWNGGMKGMKGTTDEGGVRSVCYLRWPARLPAGRAITRIAGAIDLLPTLTALAGIPRVGDKPLDGRDLTPLLYNPDADWPDRMLFSTWAGRISVRTDRHRLDDQGRLFDMHADPGQISPINTREPKIAQQLSAAVEDWRRELFSGPDRLKALAGNAVDPRPFPVGYREFPITMLEARDGAPRGGVKRSSTAPNCSYFVNWTKQDDSMVWNVDVHTSGRYEVAIDYTCPEPDAGSLIELRFQTHRLTGRVAPGWDPPLYTNQDTLPRPHGESFMKEFRR